MWHGNKKAGLRSRGREAAEQLTAEGRAAASRAIREAVLALPAYQAARTVFIYVSMPQEPDTLPLIDRALRDGKRVCVPRCGEKPRMDAVLIRSRAELRPGALGIPEPPGSAPAAAPSEIELALVPCVAAGRDGSRLGRGAGYYDAFLAGQDIKKVCLCFEGLLADDIPMTEADVLMDAVVTERAVYAISL